VRHTTHCGFAISHLLRLIHAVCCTMCCSVYGRGRSVVDCLCLPCALARASQRLRSASTLPRFTPEVIASTASLVATALFIELLLLKVCSLVAFRCESWDCFSSKCSSFERAAERVRLFLFGAQFSFVAASAPPRSCLQGAVSLFGSGQPVPWLDLLSFTGYKFVWCIIPHTAVCTSSPRWPTVVYIMPVFSYVPVLRITVVTLVGLLLGWLPFQLVRLVAAVCAAAAVVKMLREAASAKQYVAGCWCPCVARPSFLQRFCRFP
jgi:hypothetical protein